MLAEQIFPNKLEFQIQPDNVQTAKNYISHGAVSDKLIDRLSTYLCFRIGSILPDLFYVRSQQFNGSMYSAAHTTHISQERFLSLYQKISHFIQFFRGTAQLITTEALHVVFLIDQLIQFEQPLPKDDERRIVSECNLGTLLLCGLMLALKLNRDATFKNSWWAQSIGIPVDVVNQSETVMLERLNFSVSMSHEEWSKLMDYFCAEEINILAAIYGQYSVAKGAQTPSNYPTLTQQSVPVIIQIPSQLPPQLVSPSISPCYASAIATPNQLSTPTSTLINSSNSSTPSSVLSASSASTASYYLYSTNSSPSASTSSTTAASQISAVSSTEAPAYYNDESASVSYLTREMHTTLTLTPQSA
ncbi:uncharacterized protein MONOS_2195 [Monocercomonoides exilis]|uniref:uncharacterized protein n=1 Tax=Monocercomonoides exilis TaxID=2049356 RepID=UPI003559F897|nr:hypothetical protein MONOS_2195 [Monocercomonoides exilis]|eukprot:MONOS_2195.1-p1 / transcript=MONOS_2195.1 / gene=MONOS_2195 / organism=Monocercomonoides_exilis_PA203 / gene_product=unspecified product / transcript_product=unspecified product / location=Mono_scaffold00043:151743-152822(-) / protein_length=359 / sequence_SO=supercontig / SO=protein_coding / is_pseudo=false